MYLPTDGILCNQLVLEALCLSLAEAHCGTCSRITIRLSERTVTIDDNGLGLSMDPDEGGVPFAEKIFTKLHACRDHKAHQKLTHELCGAGIVVVNALSECFHARIRTGGAEYHLRFASGERLGNVECSGPATNTGTRITFTLDPAFAGAASFDARALGDAIREKGLNLSHTEIIVEES
jgi:DNA gyrase/topoisomerase IV subunit B